LVPIKNHSNDTGDNEKESLIAWEMKNMLPYMFFLNT
jgi:hypothetical protein